MKIRKRILKIAAWVFITLVLLSVSFAFAIRRPAVQTWLVNQTTNYLSNKLHAKVHVGSVDIAFFKTIVLNDVYVLDKKQDTILSVKQLNVSIGLFKLMNSKFSINKISLNDVTFNMMRLGHEKNFNFQFIIDAFASKDMARSKSPPPDLNVKQINLTDIRFHLRDEPSTDLKINLPSGEIDLNKLDLKNPTFDIKSLIFNQPDVRVIALLDTAHYAVKPNDTAVIHLNRKKLQLLVNKLRLNDAHFKFDDESELPDTTKFDTYHMEYRDINLAINNGRFVGDSIVGEIGQISCKEKSGLVVDTLYAKHARVTPRISEMTGLYVRTPNSMLKNYFSFNYKRFPDFNNLLTKVILDGDFKNSLVSMKDIGIFAPQLRGNKQLVTLTGKIIGPVDNLRGKNLVLNAGNETFFKGDAFFRGLPNIDETYLELSINESRTNYSDLKTLLPAIQFSDNIARMGTIEATGSFSGFFNDFVVNGLISSSIGVIQSDLNMKLPRHAPVEYSGNLSTSGFNVGKFIGVDSLIGNLSMISKVNGSGLNIKDVSANLLGHIDVFEFNHYAYSNVSVDGLFDKKLFTGKLLVQDPNIHLDFQGTVNFNDSVPHFNFYATLDSANLKALHFSKREFVLSSELNINIGGKKLDELYGNARADNIVFSEGKNNFSMDSLILNVANSGKNKTFSVHADLLSLLFNGEFHLVTLAQSSIALIGHYFPSLPIEHTMPEGKQDFDYSLKIFDAKSFIDFFFPRYSGISNSHLNGHFNSEQNSLTIDGEIPQFGVKSMLGRGIIISVETDKKRLNINVSSDYLQLNDSLKALNPYFSTVVVNDTATINIKAVDVSSKYRLDVTSRVIGKNDFVSVRFLPSKLVLNNDSWSFTPDNELLYKNGNLTVTNFSLVQLEQKLSLSNLPTTDNTTDLRIAMDNVHFEDFYNLIHFSSYSASGVMNGNIDLINVFHALRLDSHANINNFQFNGDSVNKIIANINYNSVGDEMSVKVELKDKLYDIEAIGNYIPRSNTDSLNFKLNVERASLPILNKYLSDYVSNISGKPAFGNLYLRGTVSNPQLNGTLTFDSVRVRVNYLQTAYLVRGAQIEFKDNLIDIKEFKMYDKDKNVATASGEITHDHLSNFQLNIQMNTDKFLFLNTVQKNNPLFYGVAYGGGIVKFTGPINNLDISATLQSRKGTVVSVPISEAQGVTQNNFIRFINTPDTIKNKIKYAISANSNLNLNLDLNMTPDALVRIIFNQRAGDIISGNGSGNIRLEINTNGKFDMYGDYTIEKGNYLFTMQNLLSKKFIIENGSTVSWSGDPYQAKIDINAIYTVSRASIADLGTPQGLSASDLRDAQRKVPVDLYMNLSGSLLSPSISFDIKIPDNVGGMSSFATTEIEELKQDEGELNKQVFGLLMLNRFLPLSSAVDPSVVSTSSISSLGEFIGNQLSYWLSQNKFNVDVNVSQAVYSGSLSTNTTDANQSDILRQEVQLALTKRFFDNRVSVDVGGNFNIYDNSTPTTTATKQQSNVYLGDFTVEYQITPDGQLALKGFYQSNYDIIDERNLDKWGGGIVFKKEFDRFKDLFRRNKSKKKKEKKVNAPVPAANPPVPGK